MEAVMAMIARDELVARLWAAVPVVERTQALFATRDAAADVRVIDTELHHLKSQFDALIGGLVPSDYLTPNGLTRIAMTIEAGRANDICGAISVLREQAEAEAERAHQGRLARIRQEADHQARVHANELDYANARRVRWAIEDYGRGRRR